ncbi:YqcI/YcgG family protein [Guptibacillus algicola]|uniref:YqcI/YcgG family protein n=1 Tax=Guptibacillus algicola TaxID=225844 RepID=UPI001CD5EABB|nr:YqcI/YcgG family protein [Alkalihalobacillus algicola]MCA0989527.1 YqcI/YcgG family protein [Alkalihalobacillus algicola]
MMTLYTKSMIDQNSEGLADWEKDAYQQFETMMCDESDPYPCVPGKMGFLEDSLRFGFAKPPSEEKSYDQLASLLKKYGEVSRQTGKYASLVVFFEGHEDKSIEEYQDMFWTLLNEVHQRDEAEWPEDIPTDPHNQAWEFCFDGEPYFCFCATPAHRLRKSRSFPYFMLAFQPRWVFDEINATTSLGQKLKKVIRNRLVKYDGIKPHSALKWYGAQDNYEWKQYFLDEEDTTMSKCPFMAMKKKLKNFHF